MIPHGYGDILDKFCFRMRQLLLDEDQSVWRKPHCGSIQYLYTKRIFTAKDARKFKFSRRVLEIDAMVAKERS